MADKDYYKILGLDRNASKEEIKRAYKRLAKKYHPDLNKGAPSASEKFREVNEAASILGDDKKRSQYDQFGSEGVKFRSGDFSGFDFSDFMRGSGSSRGFDFGDIFDEFFSGGDGGFFGDFFGRGTGRSRQRRAGRDLRFDLEIELEDAAFGAKKTIILPRLEKCTKCGGTGAASSSGKAKCERCRGTGVRRDARRTPFGIFQTETICGQCQGTGEVIKDPCQVCDGEGRIEKSRKLSVTIPKGVEDGTRLRLSGEGEAGERGEEPGDLYIVLHIRHHEQFERRGNDLFTEVRVPFTTAALGGEIDVDTLDGKAKLKIPPGTQPGILFRMRSRGLPVLNGHGRGDQNVKVKVEVPEKLSRRQRELLEEFEEESKRKKGIFGF